MWNLKNAMNNQNRDRLIDAEDTESCQKMGGGRLSEEGWGLRNTNGYRDVNCNIRNTIVTLLPIPL